MIHLLSPLLPLVASYFLFTVHTSNSPVTLHITPDLITSTAQWKSLYTDGNAYTLLLLPALWLLYRSVRPFLRRSSLVRGKAVVVTGSDTGENKNEERSDVSFCYASSLSDHFRTKRRGHLEVKCDSDKQRKLLFDLLAAALAALAILRHNVFSAPFVLIANSLHQQQQGSAARSASSWRRTTSKYTRGY